VAAEETERVFAANRARGRIRVVGYSRDEGTHPQRVGEAGSLRVRFPGPRSNALEAVILNTAGGVVGGDCLDLAFAAAEEAHLAVTSAAAEKVYRSLGPDATIRVSIEVGAGGSILWLPQETILFDHARMARSIDADLAEDARLVIAEAVVFGRAGMGERVATGRLVDRWRVRRGGRLVFAETLRLEGAIAEQLAEPAVANGGVAIATVLVVPGDEALAAGVRERSAAFCGEVGVSAWNGLALVRFCAKDGAALRRDLSAVLTWLCGRSLPRIWLN